MSLAAVRAGFAITFPGFGGFRESTSALGTDPGGLGNGQDFGEEGNGVTDATL